MGDVDVLGRPRWMDDRTDLPCTRYPANWWFAPENDEGGQVSTQANADDAAALCRLCPMTLECRAYGLRNARHGTWGALKVDTLHAATRRDMLARVERDLRRKATP